MMVALAAAASWMSFSVMPPTARWTNPSLTSSRSSFFSESVSASSEPLTSALRTSDKRGGLAGLDGREDVLELGAAADARGLAAEVGLAVVVIALGGHVLHRLVVGRDDELVAGVGDVGETEHLHGHGRPGLLDLLAVVVDERPDPTEGGAGHQRIADAERAALDEDGGHRATTDVEVRLEHGAGGPTLGVGPEVLDLGDQQEAVEQVVDAVAGEGRDLGEDRVAAPLLGDEVVLGELLHDAFGVGALAVDLVDGDDDRHLGRLGVVERLDGLGHDAVVGRHDQDHDVGRLGAAGPHGGERLVARGVDEGDARGRPSRPGRRRCAG